MPKKQRNNGKRYSDTEKMVACQIVRSNGGKLTDELLKQIQLVLNIPTLSWDTVQRWFNASVEPPKPAPVSGESRVPSLASVETSGLDYQKAAAREIVEHTFRQYATQANKPMEVAMTEGKDAAKVMADMLKLMQLLDGMPTEILGIASEFVAKATAKKLDALSIMRELINEIDNESILTEGEQE